MKLRAGTRSRPQSCRIRSMCGAMSAAWNPGDLPGTPREWLAGPDWCYTDGSAAFAAASANSLTVASNSTVQAGAGDFWMAGWVYLTNVAANCTIQSKWNSGGSDREFCLLQTQIAYSRLTFVARHADNSGQTNLSWGSDTPGTSWVFVLAWYDETAQTISLSLNGAAAVSASHTAGVRNSTQPFALGNYSDVGHTTAALGGRMASWAFGKSPPGGIASVISTISSRLYASGNGIVYADTTPAERTAWGLVSWWDLVRSGVFTDSHGSNNLTNNNGVTFGAGLPRSRAGDTDPISAWVDRWQGTTVSQSDPLKRPTLRLVGGKWVVRFDGVNDYLTNAAYTALSGVGGFVSAAALAPNNVTSNQVAVYPGSAGGILQLSTNLFYCYSSGIVYASTAAATGRRLVSVFDGSASGDANRLRAWVDGVQGSLTFFGSPGTTSGVGSGLTVGDTHTGGVPLGGDMYSLILSGATPDAAAIAALNAYIGGLS